MNNLSFLQITHDIGEAIGHNQSFDLEADLGIELFHQKLEASEVVLCFSQTLLNLLKSRKEFISVPRDSQETASCRDLTWQTKDAIYEKEGLFYYRFELTNIGHLIIVKQQKFENYQVPVISTLVDRLAIALNALTHIV